MKRDRMVVFLVVAAILSAAGFSVYRHLTVDQRVCEHVVALFEATGLPREAIAGNFSEEALAGSPAAKEGPPGMFPQPSIREVRLGMTRGCLNGLRNVKRVYGNSAYQRNAACLLEADTWDEAVPCEQIR